MKRDELFKHIREFREGAGRALKSGVECPIGEMLYDFVIEHDVKSIVETGVCHGFSSWYFLEALSVTGGKLYSIEPTPQPQIVVPGRFKKDWTVIVKPSPDSLFDIFDTIHEADLFWHDSIHTFGIQMGEFAVAMDHVTYIGGHDLYRTGAWVLFLKLFKWEVEKRGRHFAIAKRP